VKQSVIVALTFVSFATLLNAPAFGDEPLIKPNIILMLADDMGMGDTSAFQDFTGNADDVQLHTPNMERLASQGMRFTDAHTPSSRCSPTRYGLLTGRYPWRNRLKHWVLFGVQGDPMIEADRPTLATMLKAEGYKTGMVGKWHVGLRYRNSEGKPAAGWQDADLKQPLYTTPLDHGFDYARFTSRSHGTSGPDAGAKKGGNKNAKKRNGPNQTVGAGHIHGRMVIGATANSKQLKQTGREAYVLTKLGSRHSNNAIEFLHSHVTGEAQEQPFFLYYATNANHTPYTPDVSIDGKLVAGASKTKAGESLDARHDFVYENDVALGRLLDWLAETDDPRNTGHKLSETTLVIFTSDNGAEKNSNIATGPFRSNKGSVYEGGHRVPFIAAWPGQIEPATTSRTPIGLQDIYATLAEIVGANLPDLRQGEKGAEDSMSILRAFLGHEISGKEIASRPLFFNDHNEAKTDRAVVALRVDSPVVDGKTLSGQWKIFFDAALLRAGKANPFELYNLSKDSWESENLIDQPELEPLVKYLTEQAILHRTAGGHRFASFAPEGRVQFSWGDETSEHKNIEAVSLTEHFADKSAGEVNSAATNLKMTVRAVRGETSLAKQKFDCNANGLGIVGAESPAFDTNEAILISFNRDCIIESAAIVAGDGVCGGFYQVGDDAPLAVYCVDADNDAQDQSGILSDLGVLKAGETLRLDTSPHYGVEAAGQWRLRSLTVRPLK